MGYFAFFLTVSASLASLVVCAAPSYTVYTLPNTWQKGQTGTNQCAKYGASSPTSLCQNIFINSATDFCLWGPPKVGEVGVEEESMVSYCTKSGYGTRLIPDGTLHSAYFIQSDSFVQVTGRGDFTKINVKKGDDGGELDPHGANGLGNPIGGLVFSRNTRVAPHQWVQLHEWNVFLSDSEFSMRACWGPNATSYCPHVYDEMGSSFNEPGAYKSGHFEDCLSDDGLFPGVYGTSTFWQGEPHTPDAHPAARTSSCHTYRTVHQGMASAPLYYGKSITRRRHHHQA